MAFDFAEKTIYILIYIHIYMWRQSGKAAGDAGLYLPTSDIDLVVMDSGAPDVKMALRALSRKLSESAIATNIQVSQCCAHFPILTTSCCNQSGVTHV